MAAVFKDYFSGHAADYARYRPTYPAALYDFCATLPARRQVALDCATGNGQAALGLAAHFARVVGTDASAQQVLAAPRRAAGRPRNTLFAVAPAERAPLADRSADLVMVAQALHWLHHDAFYREVERVIAPGGALVATMYDFLEGGAEIDAAVMALRHHVDPFWPPERAGTTAEGFARLPFLRHEQAPPAVTMLRDWTLAELLGYLSTWSAVRRFVAARGSDPVAAVAPLFAAAWGDPETRRPIRWPLMVRVGRAG